MPSTTLLRFKKAAKAGQQLPADTRLQKDALTQVESGEGRVIRFVISSATVDRDLDTISVDGWDLTAYRKNPVVLWGHNSDELPIGKCVSIFVEAGKLKADVEFLPADTPCVGDRAEAVFRMCRDGFLSATSVGFRPLEWKLTDDEARGAGDYFPGVDFSRQELMEFSIVSIPCNPEALIEPGAGPAGTLALAAGPEVLKAVRAKVVSSIARKGLYDISSLARLLSELGWLHQSVTYEEQDEADQSAVPAKLGEAMRILGDALVTMTAEEVAELLAQVAATEQRSTAVARRKQRRLAVELTALL
ncbi:HK97 family phage prohead protease [Roseomonas elaeocarpi]|uniref:HK97 family phage prohead protease n=1 Tax=Roseomonas elaeocarpi TaxID=907779 RepID=A0ABV6JRK4_9PROT